MLDFKAFYPPPKYKPLLGMHHFILYFFEKESGGNWTNFTFSCKDLIQNTYNTNKDTLDEDDERSKHEKPSNKWPQAYEVVLPFIVAHGFDWNLEQRHCLNKRKIERKYGWANWLSHKMIE